MNKFNFILNKKEKIKKLRKQSTRKEIIPKSKKTEITPNNFQYFQQILHHGNLPKSSSTDLLNILSLYHDILNKETNNNE